MSLTQFHRIFLSAYRCSHNLLIIVTSTYVIIILNFILWQFKIYLEPRICGTLYLIKLILIHLVQYQLKFALAQPKVIVHLS